jgi:uncharacterized membrane protein YhhN
MGSTAILVGLLVAVLAATCWYAGDKGASYVARPTKIGAILALIVLALLLGARDSAGGIPLLVGLVLSMLGDIALTRDDTTSFAVGLLAFLAGHLAYIWAFAPQWFHLWGVLVVALVLAPFAALSFPRAQADRHPLRAGHVPLPLAAPACTSATRWATSAPTCTPATSG